jgi:uncharacterized protein YdeI (YjbR/CyaY-like superfamily)
MTIIRKAEKIRLDEDANGVELLVLPGILHEVPDEMGRALRAAPDMPERWNSLTPIQRNEWICWVTMVKKPETRSEHIRRMIEELKEGKRKPCCWPGCPHRKPSAQKWFKNGEI